MISRQKIASEKAIMTTMKKKFDNEKTAENDISDVKFANMTNLRSFKYANMFINKTFNNFL
jgi:hypothetical protein